MAPYKRTTLKITSCAPDLIPQDVPDNTWSDARNVYFRNGETIRATPDVPTGITRPFSVAQFLRVGVQPYWIYASSSGVWVWDGVTEFDVTPVSWIGPGNGVWTACTLGGIAYINSSDRDPVYWAGIPGNICEPLPDWPLSGRCNALRASNNFLFAIGMTTEGPGQRVRWSDAAEPGSVPQFWTPEADNLAGFIDLSPTSSPARDGVDLAGEFFIFKEESIHALRFVGGNAVWSSRQAFREHGIRAANGWVRGPSDEILFLGEDGDAYVTNGQSMRSILDGRAQRRVYAGLTADRAAIVFGVLISREKLGFLCFPNGSGTYQSLMYDFSTGDISFRDLPAGSSCAAAGEFLTEASSQSWDGDPQAWEDSTKQWDQIGETSTIDDAFIGGSFGLIAVSLSTEDQFLGGDIVVSLDKTGIDFGDAQSRKLIGRIWPKVTGRAGDVVNFRIGGQEITGGAIQFGPTLPFTIGQTQHLDALVSGRFLSIEVTSVGGSLWKMANLDVEVKLQGKF